MHTSPLRQSQRMLRQAQGMLRQAQDERGTLVFALRALLPFMVSLSNQNGVP